MLVERKVQAGILKEPRDKVDWRLFTMGDAKAILLGFHLCAFVLKEPEGRALTVRLRHGYEGDGVSHETMGHTETVAF